MGGSGEEKTTMFVTIQNASMHRVRVKVSDQEHAVIRAKSSISTNVSVSYYKQLKTNPAISLFRTLPYDIFLRILKENKALKSQVEELERRLAESGRMLSDIPGISDLMNIAYGETSDVDKLAIFRRLIEDNLKIREED